MFSPYYAAARRRSEGARADPLRHNAVNVALYALQGGRHRWAMTERGRPALHRQPRTLRIGPSQLTWEGDTLDIELDEVTAPWPSRIRGHLRVHARGWQAHPVALDTHGRHRWSVLASCARIDVALAAPALRWSGAAYVDRNWGDAPLESAFTDWNWSRAHLRDGSTVVFYDVQRRDADRRVWGLRFDAAGQVKPVALPEVAALPASGWHLARHARSEPAQPPRVLRALEDGPFYTRSLLQAQWQSEPVIAVHESLCLQRFGSRWVQALLPFRMPRRG